MDKSCTGRSELKAIQEDQFHMEPRPLLENSKPHLSKALARSTDLVVQKGQGPYLYTADGERYLDFVMGIAVNSLGHNHPAVVAAAKQQIENLIHGSFNLVYYPSAMQLAIDLAAVAPGDIDAFFFSNSGAEAVEGALKLARYTTRRPAFIAFTGAFHGRTMGATSMTSSSGSFRLHYAPFLPSIFHAPYPYCFRCEFGRSESNCSLECLSQLRRMLDLVIRPEDVAAVLIEPMQGESGYIPAPKRFIQALRNLCDELGLLLIFDEVQSGFGRTGEMFAADYYGVAPDIICLGKAIASGFPLSAVGARKELMDKWSPGAHGTTFGGNPVSCAAAVATLKAFHEEGIVQRSRETGAYLRSRLDALRQYPIVGDVRGLGMMLAVEFVDAKGQPNGPAAAAIIKRCLENKLLLMACGPHKQCIRFMAPLNIEKNQLDEGLAVFEEAVQWAATSPEFDAR